MNEPKIKADRIGDEIKLQIGADHYRFPDEIGKQIIWAVAKVAWPELTEANVLRLMANESLTRRVAELETDLAKCEAENAHLRQQTVKLAQLEAENDPQSRVANKPCAASTETAQISPETPSRDE